MSRVRWRASPGQKPSIALGTRSHAPYDAAWICETGKAVTRAVPGIPRGPLNGGGR